MTATKPLSCSFCAKPQHAVRVLVLGPGSATICDRCVELAVETVDRERKKRRDKRLATGATEAHT